MSLQKGWLAAAAVMTVLWASGLSAHPFDEVVPKVRVIADLVESRIFVEYTFEYPTVRETLVELQNGTDGLDRDRDGVITPQEVSFRIEKYLAELQGHAQLTLDKQPMKLHTRPKQSRAYKLDSPEPIEGIGDWRLAYELVMSTDTIEALREGKHTISYTNTEPKMAQRSMTDNTRAHIRESHAKLGSWRREVLELSRGRVSGRFEFIEFTVTNTASSAEPNNTAATTGAAAMPQPPQGEGAAANMANGTEPVNGTTLGTGEVRIEGRDEQYENLFRGLRDRFKAGGWEMWLVLLLVFGYGALHALAPGHGKTLVASYLVGTYGRVRDALMLGVTVTLAHTSGVFLFLGLWRLLEMWYPELGQRRSQVAQDILIFLVGLTIFVMGVGLLLKRAGGKADHHHDLFGRHTDGEGSHTHTHDGHTHTHDSHVHDHSHSHDGHAHAHDGHHHHHHEHHKVLDPKRMTTWEIIRLGILGGLVPCPGAIAIAFVTLPVGDTAICFLLVGVFSLGLACVLAAIGILLVWTKGYVAAMQQGSAQSSRFMSVYLPLLGALGVTLVGFMMLLASGYRFGWLTSVF